MGFGKKKIRVNSLTSSVYKRADCYVLDDRGGVVADVPFWGHVATVPHWSCAKLKLGVRQKASLDRTLKVLLICANISYLKLPTVELLTGIFVCLEAGAKTLSRF